MRAAIMQPTYLPWMGYFDLIDRSDVFIFLDDVELSKQSWQQRNKILGPDGPFWLTVPVEGSSHTLIQDAKIDDEKRWRDTHRKSFKFHYQNASYYPDHEDWINEVYATPWENLSELNISLIRDLTERLGLSARFHRSSEFKTVNDRVSRITVLCNEVGADQYLSPLGSHAYLDEGTFAEEGIQLSYQHFEHPEYEQVYGDTFTSHLSAMDLMLNTGPESLNTLRSGQRALMSHAEVEARPGHDDQDAG